MRMGGYFISATTAAATTTAATTAAVFTSNLILAITLLCAGICLE